MRKAASGRLEKQKNNKLNWKWQNTLQGCICVQQHHVSLHSNFYWNTLETMDVGVTHFYLKPYSPSPINWLTVGRYEYIIIIVTVKPLIKLVSKITMKLNPSSFSFWPHRSPLVDALGASGLYLKPTGLLYVVIFQFHASLPVSGEELLTGSVVSSSAYQIELIVSGRQF